jgi:hypothetical protein
MPVTIDDHGTFTADEGLSGPASGTIGPMLWTRLHACQTAIFPLEHSACPFRAEEGVA